MATLYRFVALMLLCVGGVLVFEDDANAELDVHCITACMNWDDWCVGQDGYCTHFGVPMGELGQVAVSHGPNRVNKHISVNVFDAVGDSLCTTGASTGLNHDVCACWNFTFVHVVTYYRCEINSSSS